MQKKIAKSLLDIISVSSYKTKKAGWRNILLCQMLRSSAKQKMSDSKKIFVKSVVLATLW